jgi:hypothetical protein
VNYYQQSSARTRCESPVRYSSSPACTCAAPSDLRLSFASSSVCWPRHACSRGGSRDFPNTTASSHDKYTANSLALPLPPPTTLLPPPRHPHSLIIITTFFLFGKPSSGSLLLHALRHISTTDFLPSPNTPSQHAFARLRHRPHGHSRWFPGIRPWYIRTLSLPLRAPC